MSKKSRKPKNSWVHIVCPFFNYDETNQINAIHCEGTGRNTKLRQIYETKDDLQKWEKKYCRDIFNYRFCPIYSVIIKKYEE